MPLFIFRIQSCKIIIQDIKLREHTGLLWTGEIGVTYFYNHVTLMETYRYNVKKLTFCQFACEFDKEYMYCSNFVFKMPKLSIKGTLSGNFVVVTFTKKYNDVSLLKFWI